MSDNNDDARNRLLARRVRDGVGVEAGFMPQRLDDLDAGTLEIVLACLREIEADLKTMKGALAVANDAALDEEKETT